VIQPFAPDSGGRTPELGQITAGPDGKLYATAFDPNLSDILQITTAGAVLRFFGFRLTTRNRCVPMRA